jgi:predicted ATPase
LLERTPSLQVLATSQERLRLIQETVFQIGPLSLPPRDAAVVSGYGAVDLYLERAGAADRRFVLDAGNATSVVEICRNLDGVPLAIEMAAAQLPSLGVEGVRAGLATRLQMSAAAVHGGRYSSLRAMVEWSYGLLDPEEQRLFRRLAIFAGSFSLEATAAVAGADKDPWDTLDELGRLVDKSLVAVESSKAASRRAIGYWRRCDSMRQNCLRRAASTMPSPSCTPHTWSNS